VNDHPFEEALMIYVDPLWIPVNVYAPDSSDVAVFTTAPCELVIETVTLEIGAPFASSKWPETLTSAAVITIPGQTMSECADPTTTLYVDVPTVRLMCIALTVRSPGPVLILSLNVIEPMLPTATV